MIVSHSKHLPCNKYNSNEKKVKDMMVFETRFVDYCVNKIEQFAALKNEKINKMLSNFGRLNKNKCFSFFFVFVNLFDLL